MNNVIPIGSLVFIKPVNEYDYFGGKVIVYYLNGNDNDLVRGVVCSNTLGMIVGDAKDANDMVYARIVLVEDRNIVITDSYLHPFSIDEYIFNMYENDAGNFPSMEATK